VQSVIVHPRVSVRHPDISCDDVLVAWDTCLRSGLRGNRTPDEQIAVGLDGAGRLIEMVAVRLEFDSWLIYHAMTPPSRKTLEELGLNGERRK